MKYPEKIRGVFKVENHQLIINELEKVETWKDEESFLVDALIMTNAGPLIYKII